MTNTEIRKCFSEAPKNTHHILVIYGNSYKRDFPIYIVEGMNIHTEVKRYTDMFMPLQEVYSLTGKYTLEEQLKQYRSLNWD